MIVIEGKEIFTTMEELVNPEYTALLLIDIQNDYIKPGGYFDKRGWSSPLRQVVPRVQRVLESARRNHVLVVHVQFTQLPGYLSSSPASLRRRILREGYQNGDPVGKLEPYCIEGSWGWQIVEELAPLPNELVVRKYRPSAFIGTNLDMLLDSNSVKSVVIVGVETPGCVMATAIDAEFFNYYPVVLRDCVAGHSPKFDDAALLVVGRSRDVVDSEQVLEVWERRK